MNNHILISLTTLFRFHILDIPEGKFLLKKPSETTLQLR